MSKRKLDELFQETFSGHIEVPDERVWDSIAASLDKKKKKRILPLWWSIGGIAAALVIGFMIFNPFTATDTMPAITDVEQKDPNLGNQKNSEFKNDNNTDSTIADKEETLPVLKPNDSQIVHTSEKSTTKNVSEEKGKTQGGNGYNKLKPENTVVQNKTSTTNAAPKESSPKKNENNIPSNTAVTQTDINKGQKEKNNSNDLSSDNPRKILEKTYENQAVTENKNTPQEGKTPDTLKKRTLENNILKEENSPTEVAITKNLDSVTSKSDNKKSIFDAIATVEEETQIADNSSGRWSAGPSVAPVYFNAIGEGSSVHSIFVPNSKSGNVNMSYGLSVGYEINTKLKIRSGVHRVDFGYDTNEISFSSSPVATTNGQIDNIDYRLTARNLVVSSNPGGSALPEPPVNSIDVSAPNPERSGFMTQQLGYLEIPVELNYALVDKKFGLNLIGGVSSLFLMNNSVALTSGNLTTEMGEANNLNNLNFSANFGLGLNYKFSNSIQLNLEPVFKYQLNTFSETAGTFNPYAVGVYSGLSFKF